MVCCDPFDPAFLGDPYPTYMSSGTSLRASASPNAATGS